MLLNPVFGLFFQATKFEAKLVAEKRANAFLRTYLLFFLVLTTLCNVLAAGRDCRNRESEKEEQQSKG